VIIEASWAELATSSAATAKPLPTSPARAASMVAFRASRLVWSATAWIRLVIAGPLQDFV